jgi:hypothetical protein
VKLGRETQADYEIDDFDVVQVERTAEDRRGFGADADPLPRFQFLCELLGREGSRQFYRMIISVPAVLTKPSGRGSAPGAV